MALSEKLRGELAIPGSKSHTIRALLLAALARDGRESVLSAPLVSEDTLSARRMVEQLGARVWEQRTDKGLRLWRVRGIPAAEFEQLSPLSIDVGNSGTSLYLGTAVAALFSRPVRFDGDASIRRRSAQNLLEALQNLGARVSGVHCPYTVQGPLRGGATRLSAPTSQYLSALLLALPLSAEGGELYLDLLNEHPYVDMTLEWLRSQNIQWRSEGYERYQIPGGQCYRSFQRQIPADFSSATFFFCAAAITGSTIRLLGLDPSDSQGDRQTLDFLQSMGCTYRWHELADRKWSLEFCGPQEPEPLRGADLDLSRTPDALPALAVACACAKGSSRIFQVAHARAKETDRIACMAQELQTLGFAVQETPDGLLLRGGAEKFRQTKRQRQARGYSDHRIIMALSLLNLLRPRYPLVLDDTRYAAVTFPGFFASLESLKA